LTGLLYAQPSIGQEQFLSGVKDRKEPLNPTNN
jgi:hypothetical protein